MAARSITLTYRKQYLKETAVEMTGGLSVLGIRGQTTLLQPGIGSMLLTPAETRTQLAKNFERHLRLLIDSLLKFLWAEHQQFCLLLSHNCRGARRILKNGHLPEKIPLSQQCQGLLVWPTVIFGDAHPSGNQNIQLLAELAFIHDHFARKKVLLLQV